jgi:hypothetical protein
VGGGGCCVQAIGRAADDQRRVAPEVVRGWDWEGSPSTPSRENFEILYHKRNIFMHYKWLQQCYLTFWKPVMNDCLTPANQAEKYLVANFVKSFLQNSWSIIKITTQMKEHWKHCQNVSQYKTISHRQTIAIDYATFLNMQYITQTQNSVCQNRLNCWLLSMTLNIKPNLLNVHYFHCSLTDVTVSNA